MAFIEWNDDLSVNVEVFDAQHKKLVGLINHLHESMSLGKGKDVLGQVLNDLIEYTITHFADEEAALKKYGFHGYSIQLAEHHSLTAKVLDLQRKLSSGEAVLSIDIMKFLKEWLTHHILETDKQYGVFFASKGITL